MNPVKRNRVVAVLLACGLLAASGCIRPPHLRVHVPEDVTVPQRCAVMFFADGVAADVFDNLLHSNDLPAIDRRFIQAGVRADHAVTAVPSITYGITTTLLTGRVPGHHDILGNKWFDRTTFVYRDYNLAATYQQVEGDYDAPTIYEILDDRFTVSIQCANRRGVTRTIDLWTESGVCFFFGWHHWADGMVARSMEQVVGLARREGRWPDFIHLYFPGLDADGHQFGCESEEYRGALKNIDKQIGKVCDALEAAGVLDRTYLALVSDHGHVATPREQYLDLTPMLRKRHGWRIHEGRYDSGPVSWRRRHFEGVDAVAINGGNRVYSLHLSGPEGWRSRPDFDRCRGIIGEGPDSLVAQAAIFAAACRTSPDEVWICGKDGAATVARRRTGERLEYRYDVRSGDPLGYLSDASVAAFVQQGWHESRAWLAATAGLRCPDTVAQIVEVFDSPRSADILLFAVEGWDFARCNLGGHGSIVRGDMVVPMCFAGPGIRRHERIPVARTCDVAPTIVELLAGP
ncbi:MAG: alkaline phosphatase family protein, partial [Phycisphaerae bacterium]|nr:alkaline phosphatase family protein [Phycisphaerae bacterium]